MLKRLAEKHADSVAQLTYQYRMHEDICQLSNDLVYGGKLKCANDHVRRRKLDLQGFPENIPCGAQVSSMEWLTRVVDPSESVVFVDTDKIGSEGGSAPRDSFQSLERTSGRGIGGAIVNDTEASLVRDIVGGLLSCGLDASSIGLICPFRAQVIMLVCVCVLQ
jgi:DNA replication ATP-dependent helicase Dna2